MIALKMPHSDLLSRVKPPLYAVAGFSLVINLLMLTGSVYMMQVFDRVLTSQSMPTLFYLTLMAAAALAVVGLLDYLRAQILIRIGSWLDMALGGLTLTRSLENAVSGRSYRSQALRDLTSLRASSAAGRSSRCSTRPGRRSIWPSSISFTRGSGMWRCRRRSSALCAALNHWLTAERIRAASSQQAKGFTQVEAAFRNAEVIDSMAMTPALAMTGKA